MADPRSRDVFRIPGYLAFWSSYTVSAFGTYITTLALQVLVLLSLGGTAADVGFVNAARWLPYLLLGLIVGALVDRRRRKPILIGTDLGRAVLLAAIPILFLLGLLSVPVLVVFVALFGLFSLFGDAASQSFLPRIVPRASLFAAHARTDQSDAVAQTSGPLVAGGLITLIGAPFAVLVDAFTYLFSAFAISRIRVVEPDSDPAAPARNLRREIAEGLRWVYRHPVLAPMAIATHGWFFFNAIFGVVFVSFALLGLGLSALELSRGSLTLPTRLPQRQQSRGIRCDELRPRPVGSRTAVTVGVGFGRRVEREKMGARQGRGELPTDGVELAAAGIQSGGGEPGNEAQGHGGRDAHQQQLRVRRVLRHREGQAQQVLAPVRCRCLVRGIHTADCADDQVVVAGTLLRKVARGVGDGELKIGDQFEVNATLADRRDLASEMPRQCDRVAGDSEPCSRAVADQQHSRRIGSRGGCPWLVGRSRNRVQHGSLRAPPSADGKPDGTFQHHGSPQKSRVQQS